jgi:hypothetical protein
MAVATDYGVCRHCGESIALRTYAVPFPPAGRPHDYGVKLWTAGDGRFPGDQRFCESHVIDADGSIGDHEATS